ncbi:Tigger transposable element-derived protein 6 [Dictyocoela muelleri]|nr:Tigger transposable element-derived protein 6 [Dictyocoela muelleri]
MLGSMEGEKPFPLVIGHFKTPRPLKNFSPEEVGINYTFSSKAWMNSSLFIEYLERMDNDMSRQNRKILLLLDNAPAHKSVKRSHVELLYFPKNTTSIIQPLDMGIIKAFKDHYQNALINSIDCDFTGTEVSSIDSLNIKDAIILISIAWDKISKETIINCFSKGLQERESTLSLENSEDLSIILEGVVSNVYDEFFDVDDENILDADFTPESISPRDMIKTAFLHFEKFYALAGELSSSKMKELMLLKIEIIKE